MNALSLPNKTMLNLLSTYESHIHHLNGSFFKKAENLKNFTISFGTIGAISPEVITGVTKGKELSLAGNKIHYLPFDLFTLLTDLAGKGVNMHDNEIHSFSDTDEETPEAYAKPRKANRGLLLGISLLLCVLLLGCVAVVATFYFRRRQSEIDFNQLLSELNSGSESERGLHYEAPASCLQV